MIDKSKKVHLLFLDTLTHSQNENESLFRERQNYQQDEIEFSRPVKIELIRIPRLDRDLYGKCLSKTQKEPIKSFEIYFRNIQQGGARYSLLTSNNELLASSTDDILITPKQTVYTDLLLIKGNFTKITLCIYGIIIDAQLQDKLCPYFNQNNNNNNKQYETFFDKKKQLLQSSIQLTRNIFDQSSQLVKAIQKEVQSGNTHLNLDYVQSYHQMNNDDQIHQPQIKNISNICQTLLKSLSSQNPDNINILLTKESFIANFRFQIQELANMLSKIFKSKHMGLYYPTPHRLSTLPNHIPLGLAELSIYALNLSRSDQIRSLQMLKYMVQMQSHAKKFVQKNGVSCLIKVFVDFFVSQIVTLSTFKTLIIEVFIALSQWSFAAQLMVTKIQDNSYLKLVQNVQGSLFSTGTGKNNAQSQKQKNKKEKYGKQKSVSISKQKQKQRQKQKSKLQRQRSRQKNKKKKASKDSSDDSSDSDDSSSQRKKSKKDKRQKKSNRDKQKNKKNKKHKSKQKQKQKQKQKEKQSSKKKKDSSKKEDLQANLPQSSQNQLIQSQEKAQKIQQKLQQSQSMNNNTNNNTNKNKKLSFYEILLSLMTKIYHSKHIYLIKALIQQITQTLTKNSDISQNVAKTTGYLRDIRQLFTPNSQIINSKTLKTFATHQPFLNQIQSKDVINCKYISQIEKVKYPQKYNLDPKVYKLLNAINWKIASKQQDQYIMTQYDQQFITLMSGLIRCDQKQITTTGLNRIINSFKVQDLISFKKQQAVVSIICQYIYKVLLQDQGVTTILYIDQLHTSLIKISNWFRQDNTFSRQIMRRVKFLTNYVMSYDHFTTTDTMFKSYSDYFLKLFKYEHYQINKINQYKKKQLQKTLYPQKYIHLKQTFSLGSFYDILPNQPLIQIDVSLKIFLLLTNFNKNIWTIFYQNKLVSGFCCLYNRISSLINFFLKPSVQRLSAFLKSKYYQKLIDNYLTVSKHLLMLLAKKNRFQVAFNQIIQEDSFQDVQLYQKCLENYIILFNAYYNDDSLISKKYTLQKIKKNLSLIIEIYSYAFQGYQFTLNKGRQAKIRNLIKIMYKSMFDSINNRAPIISILGRLCQVTQGNGNKLLYQILLSNYYSSSFNEGQNIQQENINLGTTSHSHLHSQNFMKKRKISEVLIPQNQKSLLENILHQNIFRNDMVLHCQLILLFKSILKMPSSISDKIIALMSNFYDEIQTKYKEVLQSDEQKSNQIIYKNQYQYQTNNNIFIKKLTISNKLLYIIQFFNELQYPFKNKIDQKLMKVLKYNQQILNKISLSSQQCNIKSSQIIAEEEILIKKQSSMKNTSTGFSQQLKIIIIKIRNAILNYFSNVILEIKETSVILNLLSFFDGLLKLPEIDNITSSQIIHEENQKEEEILYQSSLLIKEKIKSIQNTFKIIISLTQSYFHQSIMLYGQYFQKPHKPICQFTFTNLLESTLLFYSNYNSISSTTLSSITKKNKAIFDNISINIVYILAKLTSIDQRQYYSTQSRKNALCSLLGKQKQFPFDKLSILETKANIPKQISQTLKDYFRFPIFQLPLLSKNSQQESGLIETNSLRPKSYQYSKFVFDMISQGEQVGKSRFNFVVGDWFGGDVTFNLKQNQQKFKKKDKNNNITGTFKAYNNRNYEEILQQSLSQYHQKFKLLSQNYQFKITYKSQNLSQIKLNQMFYFSHKFAFKEQQKKSVDNVISLKKIPDLIKSPQEIIYSSPSKSNLSNQNQNLNQNNLNSPGGNVNVNTNVNVNPNLISPIPSQQNPNNIMMNINLMRKNNIPSATSTNSNIRQTPSISPPKIPSNNVNTMINPMDNKISGNFNNNPMMNNMGNMGNINMNIGNMNNNNNMALINPGNLNQNFQHPKPYSPHHSNPNFNNPQEFQQQPQMLMRNPNFNRQNSNERISPSPIRTPPNMIYQQQNPQNHSNFNLNLHQMNQQQQQQPNPQQQQFLKYQQQRFQQQQNQQHQQSQLYQQQNQNQHHNNQRIHQFGSGGFYQNQNQHQHHNINQHQSHHYNYNQRNQGQYQQNHHHQNNNKNPQFNSQFSYQNQISRQQQNFGNMSFHPQPQQFNNNNSNINPSLNNNLDSLSQMALLQQQAFRQAFSLIQQLKQLQANSSNNNGQTSQLIQIKKKRFNQLCRNQKVKQRIVSSMKIQKRQ